MSCDEVRSLVFNGFVMQLSGECDFLNLFFKQVNLFCFLNIGQQTVMLNLEDKRNLNCVKRLLVESLLLLIIIMYYNLTLPLKQEQDQ